MNARKEVPYDGHFNVQTNILMPELIKYDVIGRLESFARDFEEILTPLDAPHQITATASEVKNATKKVHLALPYDLQLAEQVYSMYEPDFGAFGYDSDSWMYFSQ